MTFVHTFTPFLWMKSVYMGILWLMDELLNWSSRYEWVSILPVRMSPTSLLPQRATACDKFVWMIIGEVKYILHHNVLMVEVINMWADAEKYVTINYHRLHHVVEYESLSWADNHVENSGNLEHLSSTQHITFCCLPATDDRKECITETDHIPVKLLFPALKEQHRYVHVKELNKSVMTSEEE